MVLEPVTDAYLTDLAHLDWHPECSMMKVPCGRPANLVGTTRCSCKAARLCCIPCSLKLARYQMPTGWRYSFCGWKWDCTTAAEAFTWKALS